MQYYSTNSTDTYVSLREAILRSLAPGGGVYMPKSVPVIPTALFRNIADMSLTDIAYVAGSVLFSSDIPQATINEIVKQTLDFDIPLVPISPSMFALELFHGPSGSFKDIGARFMAHLVDYFVNSDRSLGGKINVLVATSGDTGCAVAHGFAGIENVNVFILRPKGKLLRIPSDHTLSPASNIIPISIRGTFEDCQQLVRQAYADDSLYKRLNLTSANSINIARLLPQTFYLFHAYARLLEQTGSRSSQFVISMPCGNLGNLTASLFALQMGIPVSRIIAAGHGDERLWGYMRRGQLAVSDLNSRSLNTNLSRINRFIMTNPTMASKIECHTYCDEDIDNQIRHIYDDCGYLMDRNTAMACRALTDGLHNGETGVFLATADPAKYNLHLSRILGPDAKLPQLTSSATTSPRVRDIDNGATLPPLYSSLRNFLINNNV